jgi:pyruvate dehydrogenase (quinone)/pyruvate oxidase
MGAAHVRNVTELACRTAIAYRGVAHVTVPVDVQGEAVGKDLRSERNRANHVSDMMGEGAHLPSDDQVARAATILNSGKRVAILAGRGALNARHEVATIAERLGAPVIKPLLGKAVLPDDHPLTTGGIGLLGTRPSQEALEECDTLLIVGSSFPYIEYYPEPGKAKCVQIELDPKRVSLRCPVDAALVGDAGAVLRMLTQRLDYHDDRSFLGKAQEGMKEWRALIAERGGRADKPMKPQVVASALNRLLADDAIIATDSGTITTWAARHIDMRGEMMFSCSGNLATMACGLFLGNPEYVCDLQPVDFAAVARGFGAKSFTIEDPAQCSETLRQALATPGPVVVEAIVDPHEPPVPPKVTMRQAARFAEALARGTPHGRKIALTVASDTVREIV